nr:nucleic acid-binding, OB-fold protein [Tanacetum cinerariifolium]
MDESSPIEAQEKMSIKSGVTKLDSKCVGMTESSHMTPLKNMSTKSGATISVSKAVGMDESSQAKPHLFLKELEGNMIHCTAKSSIAHNFLRLKEDVTGYVTDVGRINYTKTGSKNLDFYLANQRYKLEVVIADDTAHTVVVMFNDTTTKLLKCSAESFLGAGEDEDDESSLPIDIRNLIGTTDVLEIKSHTYYEHPSVCTPSKPTEEKKKRRSELEDFDVDEISGSVKDSDKCNADGALNKKKKMRCSLLKLGGSQGTLWTAVNQRSCSGFIILHTQTTMDRMHRTRLHV